MGEGVGLQDGDELDFTAPSSGTYYVGVAQEGNSTYNPQVADSGVAGLVGAYGLTLLFAPQAEKVAQQWKITRDTRYSWAVVQSLNPNKDTIAGLAQRIGLQPDEAAKWLSWNYPGGPSRRTTAQDQAIRQALQNNPNQTVAQIFNEQNRKQTLFWVPNTVLAIWAGQVKNIGRYWVKWDQDISSLVLKGYRTRWFGYKPKQPVAIPAPRYNGDMRAYSAALVKYNIDFTNATFASAKKNGWVEDPMSKQQFLGELSSGTTNKSLMGTYVWGHGGKSGLLLNSYVTDDNADDYWVPYDTWGGTQEYKLGVGAMFACFTAYANSKERVQKGTNVFATNGIFWGSETVLVFPLTAPAIQNVLRKLSGLQLGVGEYKVTVDPPDVRTVLNKHKEIQ